MPLRQSRRPVRFPRRGTGPGGHARGRAVSRTGCGAGSAPPREPGRDRSRHRSTSPGAVPAASGNLPTGGGRFPGDGNAPRLPATAVQVPQRNPLICADGRSARSGLHPVDLHAEGAELRLDATEIQVHRLQAGRGDRRAFVAGKKKHEHDEGHRRGRPPKAHVVERFHRISFGGPRSPEFRADGGQHYGGDRPRAGGGNRSQDRSRRPPPGRAGGRGAPRVRVWRRPGNTASTV